MCACAEDSTEEEAAAAKPTRAGVKRGRAAAKHAGDCSFLSILGLLTSNDRGSQYNAEQATSLLVQLLLASPMQALARQVQGFAAQTADYNMSSVHLLEVHAANCPHQMFAQGSCELCTATSCLMQMNPPCFA